VTSGRVAHEGLDRLRASRRPRIAFVSHGFGGGVGRHIDELAKALADDAEVLLVQPFLRSFIALRWLRGGENLSMWFRAADEWDSLAMLLRALGVERVHFHHVHGLPQAVLELPRQLACAHDVTLHDYFPACPNYHLTGADGRFCGGEPRCHRCVDAGAAQWPLSIDAWRGAFAATLASSQRVIAPSADAARRIQGFFPGVRAMVWPHPEDLEGPRPAPLRVLVPGAISPEKGLGLLEACVADAARRSLALHFRVLGYTARPIAPWPVQPYCVAGEYPEGRLPELLAIERGDVLFFPSQCPETFSYTLSACLATSLPIVATDLGALPERLAQRSNARIVPWGSSAADVNDVLVEAGARSTVTTPEAQRMTFAAYRSLYAAALPATARAASVPLPQIEAHWLLEPREELPPWTLAALFDDAIGCGRASSLELLRHRTREADVELESLRGRIASLEARSPGVTGTERRSRITAPLRAFARLLRRWGWPPTV
jgi:glycosyltransferase involved in cell wall biosynthesis